MKNLLSLVFISLSLSLAAAPKCERLDIYDMTNLKASFEADLLSNAWRTSLLGKLSTLYFQEDGLVIAVPEALQKVETYLWSLAVDNGRAMLSFFSPSTEKEFMISPTCSGISASAAGKSIQMLISDESRKSDAELEFLHRQLTGKWNYWPNARKSPQRQFSLSLQDDGTFTLKTSPDTVHSTQEGVWHISADGQYLMLYTQVYVEGKQHYVAEAMSLKSVDFEDLVVDAKSLPRALESHTGKQPLFLHKTRA